MKPLYLEIEGFNSFKDNQKIDFKKLTEKGFFGIFGSTGSGKSSILDSITYALYGKIVRDSSGFVNLNSERAAIKYSFEIGKGRERKRYHIHRVTKRDKDGGYKTVITKLYEIIEESGEIDLKIICDGKTAVDKKIIEIIGLKDSDFTRAVVLPQGKFSEFLKTSPKDRSEMLERLFALKKYGSGLMEKVKKQVFENNNIITRVEGELSSYSAVSEEALNKLTEEFNTLKLLEKGLREEKKRAEEKYNKYKNVWELQQELNIKEKEEEKLKLNKAEIEKEKNVLERAGAAALVKPYIDSVEEEEHKLTEVRVSLKKEKENLESLEKLLKESKESYEKWLALRDKRLPELNIKKANLQQAIDLKNELKKYAEELQNLRKEYKGKEDLVKALEKDILKKANEYEEKTIIIKEKESKIIEFTTDIEEREKINEALNISKNINRLNKEIEILRGEREEKNLELKSFKENIVLLKNKEKSLVIELKEIKNKQELLIKSKPGDNNLIVEKLNECNKKEKELEALRKKYKEKLELELNKEIFDKSYTKSKIEREEKALKLKELERELEDCSKKLEKIKINNYAGIIASTLKEEEPCPVCGNTHKIKLAEIPDKGVIESLEEHLELLKKNYKEFGEVFRAIDLRYFKEETELARVLDSLKLLEEELKEFSLEEEEKKLVSLLNSYNETKTSVEAWEKNKDELALNKEEKEKEYTKLLVEIGRLEEGIKLCREATNKNGEEYIKKEKEIELLNIEFEIIKREFSFDSIEDRYNKLIEGEKKRAAYEKELTKLRPEIEELDKTIKREKEEITEGKRVLSVILESGKQKGEFVNLQNIRIKNLSENREPEEYIKEVKEESDLIIKNEKKSKELLEERINLKNETEKKLGALSKEEENLNSSLEETSLKIIEKLKENSFLTKEEAKLCYIEKKELDLLSDKVRNFEENYKKLINSIEELKLKLKGEKIEEKEWLSLKERVKHLTIELEEKLGTVAAKENEIMKMSKDLEKLKEIIGERDKYYHKKSLLNELERLLKGNKFVEFVAYGQLKYVTAEASKRLSDITKGKFELELSRNGEFQIKDNHSGGLIRSTDSLSGGELFLTSLSLALALSSHIQLKGSEPLEFFFLDEGFGTLDDELLDTVMNSLENLRSERLSIGIISHVKELRERVPVKLIVTRSIHGLGSKVKIEKS